MRSKKPKLQSKKAEKLQRGIERMQQYAEASRDHFAKMIEVGKTIEHTGPMAGKITCVQKTG
jgi:hypothetical protein